MTFKCAFKCILNAFIKCISDFTGGKINIVETKSFLYFVRSTKDTRYP